MTFLIRTLHRIGDNLTAVWNFYIDGFRNMTIGKTLWMIILVKLFIIFIVLKLFFFPDLLSTQYDTDQERAQAVRTELTDRGTLKP